MANMDDAVTRKMIEQMSDKRLEEVSDIADKMRISEMQRRNLEPTLKYNADGKVEDPQTATGDADFYWRNYKTKCATCGKDREHGRGWMFCGMTPEGEMKTFCNVDCCDAWELVGDNTNARRAAIKAQKARK
jgi:hypothetical protein